jgi:PTS system galactitol-specific IIB component
MGRMKRVYVVCASGVATSTILRMKIEEFLKYHGVDVQVTQYRVTELSPSRVEADAIVSTTNMDKEFANVVPVISGLPLITGVGENETLQQLLMILQEVVSPEG